MGKMARKIQNSIREKKNSGWFLDIKRVTLFHNFLSVYVKCVQIWSQCSHGGLGDFSNNNDYVVTLRMPQRRFTIVLLKGTVGVIYTPIISFFRRELSISDIPGIELEPVSNERSGNFILYKGSIFINFLIPLFSKKQRLFLKY